MGKLYKMGKKGLGNQVIRKVIGEKTFDTLHPIGRTFEKSYDATKAAESAASAAANETAIPLPDEEELARIRRRRARRGAREATTLSDDTFGP